MAKYFNYFPKTFYTLQSDADGLDAVTNIISRYGLEQSFKENSSVFYKYDIQDSDTPEIIAAKMYGSSERHWMVLAMNDIIDPQFEWPLEYRTMIRFIEEKYSANANTVAGQTGLEWAQTNIQSYYKVEKRTTNYSGNFIETRVEVDANTYANVALSSTNVTLSDGTQITIDTLKETKTYYDFELEENENKRAINLLKPEFAFNLEQELISVFKQ
jgi:hypothetical protein